MSMDDADHRIEGTPAGCTLTGVLRLATPAAYDRIFNPIQEAMLACAGTYTVDIRGLQFMNSSGITALSRLVLAARKHDLPLIIRGAETIAWQRKTITSLKRLHTKLTVDIE
jgi:hypothetical protein